jgi:hypothetical protein
VISKKATKEAVMLSKAPQETTERTGSEDESWDVQFDRDSDEKQTEPQIPQRPIGMDG